KNFHLYNLNQLPRLSGSSDYQHWKTHAEYILQIFNCWNIILEKEVRPVEEINLARRIINSEDIASFEARYNYTYYFLLTTTSHILPTNFTSDLTPATIWNNLQKRFCKPSLITVYDEFNSLLNLELKLATTEGFIDHLVNFHTCWIFLQQYCSSQLTTNTLGNSYRIPEHIYIFLSSSHIKAMLLLDSLPSSLAILFQDFPTFELLVYNMTPEALIQLLQQVDNEIVKVC